ncbi:MAG: RidA family protein [bacterium]|nr:RidA family protein [bacterium]
MKCSPIQTKNAPAAIGPYSQAVAAGDMLFVSGQLGLDPATGELTGSDLASQARRALENLKAVILAAGLTLDDVAAVDVFLLEMSCFAEFNLIYQEYFTEHKPARAVVAVKELPKGGCVEIKCTACLK